MYTDDSGREIRKRAEAIAGHSSASEMSSQDRLIYELKVHQIELEMQNDELQQSHQEVERSRARYELLFEFAPVPYFIFNEEGGVIDVNDAGATLLRTERSRLERKPFVVYLSDEYHGAFFNHLRRVFEAGHRQSTEVQLKFRGGGELWARLESRLQTGMKGTPQCLTAIIDVSDQKRIEDDLILARENAETANRAKNAFLAHMSHEIRTPMNGILSLSELALQADVPEEVQGYLRTIHSSAAALMSILDDVVDLSRIEEDRRNLRKEPFRPGELLQTIETMFAPNVEETRFTLTVDVPHDLSEVLVGDRNRIRQIVINLLSNAIKHTGEGEITLRVTETELSDFLRELTFEVHDGGPGIDAQERRRILEAFKQRIDDTTQRYEGRGVGLAVSRRLAALMGGQLYFESDPDAGTRFFLTVPLEVPGDDDEPYRSRNPQRGAETGAHRRILVAEDNAINLLVIRTVLEKSGFEVESVNNGQDALDSLATHPFDLV
ncbi:MAG: ATP-binding protein, partial [Alkalispirochaeta sp.]